MKTLARFSPLRRSWPNVISLDQRMPRKRSKQNLPLAKLDPYAVIFAEVVGLLEEARRTSARAVNAVMTATYWQIGRRIVEAEQRGADRADYGDVLVGRLAQDLTDRFGRGFGKSNLYQMRGFYQAYPDIFQMASGKSSEPAPDHIFQMTSGKSATLSATTVAGLFPLPWSHYVRLLSVENVKRASSTKRRPCAADGRSSNSIGRSTARSTTVPPCRATRRRC